jgi:hypothetical protein
LCLDPSLLPTGDILRNEGCDPELFTDANVATEHLLGDVRGVVVPAYDSLATKKVKKRSLSGLDFIERVIDLDPAIPLAVVTANPSSIPFEQVSRDIDAVLSPGLTKPGIIRWIGTTTMYEPLPQPVIHPYYLRGKLTVPLAS